VTPVYLPSGLHTDYNKLQRALEKTLEVHAGKNCIVFYGGCHPRIDTILDSAHTCRTPGQNCVDIYLGHEVFCRDLAEGAFFLFEDWALHWDTIVGGTQGLTPEVMREIFSGAHTRLLGIRTPCSENFTAQAEEISRQTSLELHWVDVGLDHLEQALETLINEALKVRE
jgi:hypothetical protein